MNRINGQAATGSPDSHESAEPKIRLKGGNIMLESEIMEVTPAMAAEGAARLLGITDSGVWTLPELAEKAVDIFVLMLCAAPDGTSLAALGKAVHRAGPQRFPGLYPSSGQQIHSPKSGSDSRRGRHKLSAPQH